MYGDILVVKDLLHGFPSLDDGLIVRYLNDATNTVISLVSTSITGEKVDSLDKDSICFYTDNQYIADINADKIIDKNDVVVEAKDVDGNWTTLSVNTVDSKRGKICLSSAIDSNSTIYVSYNYYVVYPDFDELDKLTNLIASRYYVISEILLLPDRWRAGGFSYSVDKYGMLRILDTEIRNILIRYVKGDVSNVSLDAQRTTDYP